MYTLNVLIVRSCASLKNYIIIIICMLHVYIYIIFRISLSRNILERHITRPFGILIFRWRANASAESLRVGGGVPPFRVTFVGTDFTIVVFIRSLVYTRGNFLLTQCMYVCTYVCTYGA